MRVDHIYGAVAQSLVAPKELRDPEGLRRNAAEVSILLHIKDLGRAAKLVQPIASTAAKQPIKYWPDPDSAIGRNLDILA